MSLIIYEKEIRTERFVFLYDLFFLPLNVLLPFFLLSTILGYRVYRVIIVNINRIQRTCTTLWMNERTMDNRYESNRFHFVDGRWPRKLCGRRVRIAETISFNRPNSPPKFYDSRGPNFECSTCPPHPSNAIREVKDESTTLCIESTPWTHFVRQGVRASGSSTFIRPQRAARYAARLEPYFLVLAASRIEGVVDFFRYF